MQDLPMLQPNGSAASSGVQSAGISPGVQAPGGSISPGFTSGAVGFMSDVTGLSQKAPGAKAGLTAAAQGLDFDGVMDAVLGSLAGWGAATAVDKLGFGYGLPGIAGSVAAETVKENPNYGAAALSSGARAVGAVIGGTVAGPLGAYLGSLAGGYFANDSLESGLMGDMAGTRSREKERDAVEDGFGVGVGDTAGMDAMDKGIAHEKGDFGFGLSAFNESTLSGKLSSAAEDAPSQISSAAAQAYGFDRLEGYLDRMEKEAGAYGSEEGDAMGDPGGRSQGDPDGDAGTDPN
jgi:hypothetical protein